MDMYVRGEGGERRGCCGVRPWLHLVTITARALAGAHRVVPLPVRLRRGSEHARPARVAQRRRRVHLRGGAASCQVRQSGPACTGGAGSYV